MYNPEPRTTDTIQCAWFACCENEATREMEHPVIGWVPICDRCTELCASWHTCSPVISRVLA